MRCSVPPAVSYITCVKYHLLETDDRWLETHYPRLSLGVGHEDSLCLTRAEIPDSQNESMWSAVSQMLV